MTLNWFAASAVALAACGAVSAAAQDAAEFYKDHTLTFVVGFGAGGGFDTYARLIAPEIEKRTGGTTIVENRPGAGGTKALNQAFRDDPTGEEILMVHGEAALLTQMTDQEGRRFDMGELQWLGRVASEPGAVVLSKQSPFQTLEDLKTADRPIKFSAGSKIDGLSDFAAVFCEVAQIECQIITGYDGSREASLAAIRGEVDAFAVEAGSAADYSKGGEELTPIAILSHERSDKMPDVPTIFEATDVPDDLAWWIDFRENVSKVGRSIAMAPGVDQAKVDYMRGVIGDVLQDKAFVDETVAKGRDINYLPGTEQQEIVKNLLSSVEGDRLKEVQNVLLEKFY